MTPELIEELERLMEKATARTWKLTPSGTLMENGFIWKHATVDVTVGKGSICATDDNNGAFIVAAGNALPQLLSEAKAAARMREAGKRFVMIHDQREKDELEWAAGGMTYDYTQFYNAYCELRSALSEDR